MSQIKTCEFVTPQHPDKICDFIADSILDAYIKNDKESRVAIEVMGGHGVINVSGEVTSHSKIRIEEIVKEIVGPNFKINLNITKQSPNIAQGVDTGGAGDQGIMIGYATKETPNFMPLEYELARSLCQKIYQVYPYDGKTQVTINGNRILSVVASFQNTKTPELEELVKQIIKADEYLINPAGEWSLGGFDADSGLSGRKLVVDNYGPEVNIGGGSFSGKDPTKVDRSAAYMARRIAVAHLIKFYPDIDKIKVKLAYAIGKEKPVMAVQEVSEQRILPVHGYNLTPSGIRRFLGLDQPIYAETSKWGHFGRNFAWE